MPKTEAVARRCGYRVPVLLTALLGLAGCTIQVNGTPVRASGGQASGPACDLLTSAEVADLAGEQLPEPRDVRIAELPACHWGARERVQAVSLPADVWARQLPAVIEQIEQTGTLQDPDNLRKLSRARELIESGGDLAPGQACDFFSTLIELQDQPPGSDSTINLQPSKDDVRAISGQTCRGGVFTSVTLIKDGLSGSTGEIERVSAALTTAHRRGTN